MASVVVCVLRESGTSRKVTGWRLLHEHLILLENWRFPSEVDSEVGCAFGWTPTGLLPFVPSDI